MSAPKHDALISAERVLEKAAHFDFNLMDERLCVSNSILHVTRVTEERTKFASSPTRKGGLVFALKMEPLGASFIETSHRARAIRGYRLPQRFLIEQDNGAAMRRAV
jgi:hypothetical protein